MLHSKYYNCDEIQLLWLKKIAFASPDQMGVIGFWVFVYFSTMFRVYLCTEVVYTESTPIIGN